MSRKITEQACAAFESGRKFASGNTTVTVLDGIVVMWLHGNAIAKRNIDQPYSLQIANGGWSSNTTKERLNGLFGVNVYQRDFTWYLNDKEWHGNWAYVHPYGKGERQQWPAY